MNQLGHRFDEAAPVAIGEDKPPRLELANVSRRFGEVEALADVSMSVRSGEIVSLVGRSGCGKSTMLRIIAGVDKPTSGRVSLDGAEVAGEGRFVEPEARQVGFMFQDYALFPHLTVVDNVKFGLKRLGRDAAARRASETLERLGIQQLGQRYPHMLSGGEQQRVALARALATQPRVLLMDEPFSNLDRQLRDGIRDETIRMLREFGATVVMVTHDPEEALSVGDRVVLMRSGRIVQIGSGSDLYDRPACAYAADFFCSFNKVPGACWNGFLETPLGNFAAPGFADGAQAVAYLRPQCLRICGAGNGVAGKVVSRRLMGEVEQISLDVAALDEPLRIRSTERSNLRVGEEIGVAIRPDDALVFDEPR